MHVNSLIAYYDNKFKFSKRQWEILGFLLERGGVWTDRQIKDALRFADMNSVRPRITELIEMGVVEERGYTFCSVTNKRVRLVRVAERLENKQAEFAL